ncbi:MAG: hypothetical protein ACTSRG_22345 [Candidatus Helarchaeota archaeon]
MFVYVLSVVIVIPTLVILVFISLKDLFLDEFDPYDNLKNIDSIDKLITNKGKGFKKFLAAIKYERLKNTLETICDGRNLFIISILYIIALLSFLNTKDFFININIYNTIIGLLPNIISVILAFTTIKIHKLKKQIGE